jgi:CxxC motif-containing protein (DUF1111 family)
MARQSRIRPGHLLVLVLVLAPAWKALQWLRGGPGPKQVAAAAARQGGVLFRHEWVPNDPLASGDGLGPVFNATSCVDCHNQGGEGGGGPVEKNVTVYGIPSNHAAPRGIAPAGVVHQKAISPALQETLAQVNPALPQAPSMSLATILNGGGTAIKGVQISQRNTPALFGDGLIDIVTDDTIIAHEREHSGAARLAGLNGAHDGSVKGRVARLADGRIGRFGWKGEFATLNDFVKAACANEVGLSNPGRPQATPLGQPGYQAKGADLSDVKCEAIADFVRSLAQPIEATPGDASARAAVEAGRKVFTEIGCADCHSPKLGPVEGLYSDLLLHDMGVDLESAPGAYGEPPVPAPQFAKDASPNPAEWRTPPLWGVADSAPYLHDGRSASLEDAIAQHGGEGKGTSKRFEKLPYGDRDALLAFLKTLRAPRARGGQLTARN